MVDARKSQLPASTAKSAFSPMSETSRAIRLEGADGVMLAAEVDGPSDGSPVLLLHGGGQTRHSWKGTTRVLIEHGWCTTSVDLRGHGESDWATDGDYSVDAFSRDCAALVGHFEKSPVLVGASLGGVISVITEGELLPGSTRALIVADIVPDMNEPGINRVRQFMTAHDDGFSSLEEASEAIAAYAGRGPGRSSAEGLLRVLRERNDGRWYWHWDPRVLSEGLDKDPTVDIGRRMGAALEHISAPILLVRGLVSDVVTTDGANNFILRAPHAEQADVSDAGHMVASDDNDAFAGAMLSFLDRRVQSAPENQI